MIKLMGVVMHSQKIFSIFLISTLAACASGGEKKLSMKTPEQRCTELEQKWDVAQQELTIAEGREDGSWLYHVADTFNPLTNSSDESLRMAKSQEQRTRENYITFGCIELNKMQMQSAFNTEIPKQNMVEHKQASVEPVSYQVPAQINYQTPAQINYQAPAQFGY